MNLTKFSFYIEWQAPNVGAIPYGLFLLIFLRFPVERRLNPWCECVEKGNFHKLPCHHFEGRRHRKAS